MPINQGTIPYFSQPSGGRNTNVAKYEVQAKARPVSLDLARANELLYSQPVQPEYVYVPRARGTMVINTVAPSKAAGNTGPRQYWG